MRVIFGPFHSKGQNSPGLLIFESAHVLVREIRLFFLGRRRKVLTERDRVSHRPLFGGVQRGVNLFELS